MKKFSDKYIKDLTRRFVTPRQDPKKWSDSDLIKECSRELSNMTQFELIEFLLVRGVIVDVDDMRPAFGALHRKSPPSKRKS